MLFYFYFYFFHWGKASNASSVAVPHRLAHGGFFFPLGQFMSSDLLNKYYPVGATRLHPRWGAGVPNLLGEKLEWDSLTT